VSRATSQFMRLRVPMATIWPSIISTAKRSSNTPRLARPLCLILLAVVSLLAARPAQACPFCTALSPTLSQQREAAQVVVLAEVESGNADIDNADKEVADKKNADGNM